MSEGLRPQLQPLGIGVSVLCPYFVRTKIGESGRNRPARYGTTQTPDPESPAGQLLAYIAERLQSGQGAAVIVQGADHGPVLGCNKLEPLVSG